MYPMIFPLGDSATWIYSGHLQRAKVKDSIRLRAGIWRVLPCEVHEVEGQVVGLRERVEVHVVVAKQIVATERAQSGHFSSSAASLRHFKIIIIVKLERSKIVTSSYHVTHKLILSRCKVR